MVFDQLPVVPLGLVTEIVSSFAETMVVVTGMFAGSTRAWAVLRKSAHEQVEWMTAAGFGFGVGVTIVVVCIDSIFGVAMKLMPRGLLVRGIAIVLGSIPLVILLHVVNPPPDLWGVAVMVYAAGGGIGIAEYGVRHPDEFPPESKGR